MASGDAWNAGWNLGSGFAQQRFAHKQALSDEEFQTHLGELQQNIGNLQAKLATFPEGSKERNDAQQNLAQAIEARNGMFAKQPGALQKFGHLLHLPQKKPAQIPAPAGYQPTLQTRGQAAPAKPPRTLAQLRAQTEAQMMAAGAPKAPLSPEQQAVQEAHAKVAGMLTSLQDTLDAVDKFYPPDQREKQREAVMAKTFGAKEEKWTPYGKPYTKNGQNYIDEKSPSGEIRTHEWTGAPPAPARPLSPGPQYFAAKKKEAMGLPLTPEEQAVIETYKGYIYETSTAPRVAGYVAGAKARADLQNEIVENPENPMQNILTTAAQARRHKYVLPSSEEHQLNIAIHKGLIPKNFGTNLASLHTAEEHLRMAGALVDTLNTGSFTPFNPTVLAWARLNGQPAPADFRVVVTSLAGEMANAFKGTGATDPEIEQIRKMINESDSPQALKSALNYSRKTLEVRRRNLWATAKMAGLNIQGLTERVPRTGGPVGGGVSVTAPDGSIHTFKNKAAADQFKKAAGIQ